MANDNKQTPAASAPDAVQLGILQALQALTAEVKALKEAKASPQAAVQAELESAAAAKRRKLREETTIEGENALYVVGPQKAYRAGVTYLGGQTIRIPKDELPSVTWEPVKPPKK